MAENQPVGTSVGSFSSTDPDAGDTFTYSLIGAGSTDNGSFTISGNTLQTAASFDYETKNNYSIRVRTTDSGSLKYEEAFTVTVTAANEAPTGISLSTSASRRTRRSDTSVGTFSTTDPNSSDTFTYTLVTGTGSTDNSSFNLGGNTLQTAAAFDYETKSSYSIRVRTTDTGGLCYEEALTITVTNVNEAPTAIQLSDSTVPENRPAGTTVGAFSTTDPDSSNTFTYTLVSGLGSADSGSFAVGGNSLQTVVSFDYEIKNTYSIRVRVTDSGGLSYEQAFTITVTNINEAPTAIQLSSTSVSENQPAGTTVGTFSTTDPDGGTFTYSLVDGYRRCGQ